MIVVLALMIWKELEERLEKSYTKQTNTMMSWTCLMKKDRP